MRGNCLYKKQISICQQITLVIVHVFFFLKKRPKSTVNNNWLNLKRYSEWRSLEAVGLVTKSHDQQK